MPIFLPEKQLTSTLQDKTIQLGSEEVSIVQVRNVFQTRNVYFLDASVSLDDVLARSCEECFK
jgi:hypothetical protein